MLNGSLNRNLNVKMWKKRRKHILAFSKMVYISDLQVLYVLIFVSLVFSDFSNAE